MNLPKDVERIRDEMAEDYARRWVIPNILSDAERAALIGAFAAGYSAAQAEIKKQSDRADLAGAKLKIAVESLKEIVSLDGDNGYFWPDECARLALTKIAALDTEKT